MAHPAQHCALVDGIWDRLSVIGSDLSWIRSALTELCPSKTQPPPCDVENLSREYSKYLGFERRQLELYPLP
jgi:hypothetical protein